MVTADTLLALLSDANVGLAIFDAGLDLTFANARYLALCGYCDNEARRGRNLRDLARVSMLRAGFDAAVIEHQIDAGLRRLRAAGGYSFSLRSPSGGAVYVHRQMLPDGGVSETVQEAFADHSNPNADRLETMAQAARTRLAHALDSMADGFALFDADDRLVLYNRRYVDLKPRVENLIAPGVSYEELLRASVDRSGYDIGDMSATDYIDWRLDQHRSPDQAYDVQTGDGRWIRVRERRTDDGGIVGTRSDITELKRREAEILRVTDELAKKKVLFETALNNMIQGLCMFDAEQRLIVCNRRYLEMYGFSAEVVKPGIKLDEIMAYSVSLGNYTGSDATRAKAERPDHAKLRTRATLKQYLRDGRVIAVMHEPMPGGGSIATYQDITESERREQALKEHAVKVEASNRELQEFAYVASHDLQEPLRKIETFGQRLGSKYAADLPEGAQLCIGRMENATGRMRKLETSDNRALARAERLSRP